MQFLKIPAFSDQLINFVLKGLREQFYSDLTAVLATLSSRDALIIAGDFNAKTGSAHNDDVFKEIVGKYGKGIVNSNGIHLLTFA